VLTRSDLAELGYTQLLGRQNDILRGLTAGAGFSGTAFARSDLAAAGLGAGF
jgi:hypothetical protein